MNPFPSTHGGYWAFPLFIERIKMATFIDKRQAPVPLVKRDIEYTGDYGLSVDDKGLHVKSFLDANEMYSILGIRNYDARQDNDHIILKFLTRCLDRNWTLEVITVEGTKAFGRKSFHPLPAKRIFARVKKVDFQNGSFIISLKSDRDEVTDTFYIDDDAILGFKLRPRSFYANNKRVNIGHIHLTRAYKKYHSYYLDASVVDTRLLEGIADFSSELSCNKPFKDIHVVSQVSGSDRFIVKDPIEMAVAVGITNCNIGPFTETGIRWEDVLGHWKPQEIEGMVLIVEPNDDGKWKRDVYSSYLESLTQAYEVHKRLIATRYESQKEEQRC